MKKVFQKIFSLFRRTDPAGKKKRRKTLGQSLVEFAITLPILLTLMMAVVEYGFMLNYYLSVVDATRDAARKYSGGEPFNRDPAGNPISDIDTFYINAAEFAQQVLDPTKIPGNGAYIGRTIPLDPALDDVIVTVYSIKDTIVTQHPDAGPHHLYPLNLVNVSRFDVGNILGQRLTIAGGGYAPNEGLLVVEIDYHYHQVLGIVFFTMFGNPVPLHAYTIMPIRAAEPQ